MFAKLFSSSTYGIQAYIVEVEIHCERKLPSVTIVGLPDSAIKESRERVTAAIINSGFEFPLRKITINLAPADIKKEGSAFDLPIAVGILAANGLVDISKLDNALLLGELSLDGSLRKVKGVLPIVFEAKKKGFTKIILPIESANEASLVDGMEILPFHSFKDLTSFLNGEETLPLDIPHPEEKETVLNNYAIDFSDVKGQENVKRALEIAAAGGHNIIMIGPPGSGKTMLAKRIPTILPPLTFIEAIETSIIHSVSGILSNDAPLVNQRPFRNPHHTVSDIALIGGGTVPKPGEVSYAHNGVLFLDELPEFKKNALEVLRQPIEDGTVTISRAKMTLKFPANFMLVAAMNPCPCGYFTDPNKECSCNTGQIQKYLSKISGPLLDRIDIHIEVPAVRFKELTSNAKTESSEVIRERVVSARKVQLERFKNTPGIFSNSDMGTKEVKKFCVLDNSSLELLKMAMTKFSLSARAFDRILKLSRTIADLDNEDNIKIQHISEAIQYRSLDREYWGK
ncbi:MAG: YifB family Mg chelatase-like AAA ATPase [Melioribacteraceae bacterium]